MITTFLRVSTRLAMVLAQLVLLLASLVAQDEAKKPEKLDAKIVAQVDVLLARPTVTSEESVKLRDQIWLSTCIQHGEYRPLSRNLNQRLGQKPERPMELKLVRLTAHYLRRLGDLERARRMLSKIKVDEETILDTLNKAEVMDALGRDKQAVKAYDRLLKKKGLDATLQNKILLRKALMTKPDEGKKTAKAGGRAARTAARRATALPTALPAAAARAARRAAVQAARAAQAGDKTKKPEDKRSALAKFAAAKGRDPLLRNQAAIILALTNEQKDAIQLFKPEGESTARFRQEIRLAEWAIECSEWKKAQDFAWNAAENAKLKRDRRYALTILVEAYRRDVNLDGLIQRFAKAKKLNVQARETWIDLLRETGTVEEALRLFRESNSTDFTTDMRRELLEICRETNQDKILEDAYKSIIKEQPKFLEWREGLARFYLERGRRKEAVATWRPYLQVTDDNRYRMAAASSLMGLGLDDLAIEFARTCMKGGSESVRENSLMFLFELHRDRGRHEEAAKALVELDGLCAPGSGVRKEMADAYARLGDKKQAVEVLTALYKAKGDETTPDTRMKLALMLSAIGEEEQALDHWVSLWRQINSVPRRRYVEERLMTVASRLGTLAKVAIQLERKLVDGKADDREAGLLVRLYIKVNDPVSATEVIEEHMKQAGKRPVEVLTEKARVFQSCEDFYNYEKVVRELIKVDPEGAPDYLRQLAMSNMERGQRKEARDILARLKKVENDSVSDEFEAGVLAIAGMRREALKSYRRGISKYPERIDTYLLLSNMQKELNLHERSAGMFQYLAATAEKDDLFTIAVDGILNMRDGRGNRGAPNRLVEWTRRVVLERLARRPNKLYLYRLVADLSEELNDTAMAIRALKTALPVAGEQRTSILRELMALSKKGRGRMVGSVMILASGVVVRNGGRNAKKPKNENLLMFGRRILGQAELVPPEVYLELGQAFLAAGEVANASKTFNQASQLPEFAELRRKIAQAFEASGYPEEALRVYEQILSVENADPGLITKVGELQEQISRDEVAFGLYNRGLELLLNRSIFVKTGVKKDQKDTRPSNPFIYMPGNRNEDEWDRHHSWLLAGLLATLPEEEADQYLSAQQKTIDSEIDRVLQERKDGKLPDDGQLVHHPRLSRRITLYRRVAVATSNIGLVDKLDRQLLKTFAKDKKLLEKCVRFRLSWGYVLSARKLIEDADRPESERKRLRLLTGGKGSIAVPGVISVPEASGLLLPLFVEGDDKMAKAVLERLDLSTGDKAALEHMPLLVGSTLYLNEPDLTLTLCRHWLNLSVKHSPGMMYGVVEGILNQGRAALDKAQLKSLTEQLLTQVVEKPDKFTAFLRRLPELRKTVGADFLTREQIEKLIKSRLEGSDRYVYGIEDLFMLLKPEDRAPALRAVWSKLPKTQTAYFLMRFVISLDNEVNKSFGEFLAAAFEKAMSDADDKRMLGYQVDQLSESPQANIKLRLQFVEAMMKTGEKNTSLLAGKAALLQKMGKTKEALGFVQEVFQAYFSSKGRPSDPFAHNAYYRITRSFKDDHADDLIKAFDAIEKKQGSSIALTRKRLSLLRQIGKQEMITAALEGAVKKHPDDNGLREQLANQYNSRGNRAKAIQMRSEALAKKPKNESQRRRLVSEWRSVRNPVKALAIRTEGEKLKEKPKETKKKAAAPAVVKKRTPRATLAAVKKALDEDDTVTAGTTFRRLWRRFSPVVQDRYFRFYSPPVYRMVWPKDKAEIEKEKAKREAEAKKRKNKRPRGGLPEMFTRELKPEEKRRGRGGRGGGYRIIDGMLVPIGQEDDKKKVVTAHSVLVKHDFGRREVQRQLRSLPAAYLGMVAARDIYKALVSLEVEKLGLEKTLAQLLAPERLPKLGKVEYGMIAALLDDAPKESLASLRESLSGLMKNLNARDEAQLRRVARLYARSGQPEKAAALYSWCSLVTRSGRIGYYYGYDDLLQEVLKTLDGDARIQTVEKILAYSDPGEYGRDQYIRMVLDTWSELLGPAEALEKSRSAIEKAKALDMLPMRYACKSATILQARSGDIERALQTLEIALCKLKPPAQTRYPWYRSSFESPGYMSTYDIAMMFPKDMKGYAKPAEWLQQAHDKIVEWHEAKRLNESVPLWMFCVIALRLHEAGNKDLALKSLERARGLTKDQANNMLWIADVARAIEAPKTADEIERKLFDEGRLHIERIPGLVARVTETEGADAGLDLGTKAAEFTLHPELLDNLIKAAEAASKSDRVEHWQKTKQAAEAALKTLEEQDKKAAEEAKKKREQNKK